MPDISINAAPIRLGISSAQGPGGKTNYELYLESTSDDPVLTLEQYLASLVGAPGADGIDGVQIVSSETPPTDLTVLWFDPSDGTVSAWDGTYWVSQGFMNSSVPATAYTDSLGSVYTDSTGSAYTPA